RRQHTSTPYYLHATHLRTSFWIVLQMHYGSREIQQEAFVLGPPAFTSNTTGVRTRGCPSILDCGTTTRRRFANETTSFRTSMRPWVNWRLRHNRSMART